MKRTDVLLVMGSPALLKTTEEALLREGFSVQSVGNGIDAVMDAVKVRPRCILCGHILAGMDGMKVCRLLSSFFSRKEMPIILSVPDSKPEMRSRALSAGAVAVVDYSTPMDEISDLVRLHLSESRAVSFSTDLSLSRDRVLPMAADCIEASLESTETITRLAGELRSVTSISEACRKVSTSVLGGLGFQRVWVGLLNRAGTAVEAIAYRGRGITGDPFPISENSGNSPVEIALSSGVQVSTWDSDFAGASSQWVGSTAFVDTPIRSGPKTIGIIRCDNGVSRRRPSTESLKCLRMLSDVLSSYIRYLDAQSRLDDRMLSMDRLFSQMGTGTVFVDRAGRITDFLGDFSMISGGAAIEMGMPLTDFLIPLSNRVKERITVSMDDNSGISPESVMLEDRENSLDLHLTASDRDEVVLAMVNKSAEAEMSARIKLLEFETDALASLAADLSSEGDVREISRRLVRTIEAFYPDESIAVLASGSPLSSQIPDSLVVNAVSGSSYLNGTLLPGASILVMDTDDTGVVGEAVRNCRTVNVADVMHCDFYINGLAETRSELAIPMLSRGRVVGLIDIQSPETGRFQADDIRRLNNIVGFAAGVMETALQQTELINMARRDRLTGLHNMTFFEERYPEEFERAQRYQYPFSLIMMDIDDFKHYNDSFGHPMGNVLLQKITLAMGSALRDVDILVRYGGEEFICILPLTDKLVAVEIAERIRSRVLDANADIPHAANQPRGFVSLSLGVATFPVDSRERDELIELADQRMYRAKRAGKNNVVHD